MDVWNWALFAVAALAAVSALVKLMLRRRDELSRELRRQAEDERRRREGNQRNEVRRGEPSRPR